MVGYLGKGFGRKPPRYAVGQSFIVSVLLLLAWFLDVGVAAAQNAEGWLPGFGTYVSGEYIGYRSAIPEAMDAILVRSLDEERYIEWETTPIPRDYIGDYVTFFSLAGYDSTADRRQWILSVDGEPWFTFSNEPTPEWTRSGPHGAQLWYQRARLDQYNDYQGFHFLKVPIARFVKGRPLRLRVTGESAGSRTWYMVFMHRMQATIHLDADPVLKKEGDTLMQRLHIDVTHDGLSSPVTFEVEGAAPVHGVLRLGAQRFYLPIEAVDEPTVKTVTITIGDQAPIQRDVEVKPVRPFEIWFLPHSHVDIGYTHPQEEVLRRQWQNIEHGIDLARRTAQYPEGARYRWNVEGMWAVDEYLRQAPKEKRKALVEAVKKGWIGLDGLYGNELTGLQRGEELFRASGENIRDLYDRHGLEVSSAMITDVPGYSWGLVPALAHNGIRYFSVGPNHIMALPHQGDRVGYTLEAWGDRPFWWEDASGHHRVLFWMTAHGYSWFHGANLGNLSDDNISDVLEHLDELDEKGYPYDVVQLRYTIGGDNGPPDEAMPDFIRRWNQTHEAPRLRIATTTELFRAFEARYGDQLPTYRGELTPYWEDGAASSARETALNRNTADKLLQAEVLWAMQDPEAAPVAQFYEAWKHVVLFSEHTWGAHNSISEPESEFVHELWRGKQAYALEAARLADALLEAALPEQNPQDPVEAVEITNTASWPRTDLVRVPAAWRLRGDIVKNSAGVVIPSQRLSTGELAFVVKDVAPMGSVVVQFHEGARPTVMAKGWISETAMSNGLLHLRFDAQTGAISSLRQAGLDRELVDADHHRGLNQYFYSGQMAAEPRSNRAARFTMLDEGPLVYTVQIESEAPGARRLRQQVRLIDGMDRVDLTNVIDKALVYDKENVRFAFPFNLKDATLRVDLPWMTLRPDEDQLDGANKNYYTVQRFVDLSDERFGLTWVTLDAPLVELGGMVGEAWMAEHDRPWIKELGQTELLYSWVMNNSWHTNYKAAQEGEAVFRYTLRTHAGYDEAAAKRFALEQSQPLLLTPAAPAEQGKPSFLAVSPWKDVLVTSFRPSRDGKARIARLFNASTQARQVDFSGALSMDRIYRSGPGEQRGAVLQTPFTLEPGEIVTVRFE